MCCGQIAIKLSWPAARHDNVEVVNPQSEVTACQSSLSAANCSNCMPLLIVNIRAAGQIHQVQGLRQTPRVQLHFPEHFTLHLRTIVMIPELGYQHLSPGSFMAFLLRFINVHLCGPKRLDRKTQTLCSHSIRSKSIINN